MRNGLFTMSSLVVMLSASLGCQPTQHTDFSAFVREPRPTVVGRDYLVGVPDGLVVTIMSDRGVEEVTQTLGPDGKLRLKGFGIVQAAGRSCSQITDALNEIAQTTPSITSLAVRVQTFASQKVFVFGQVQTTGGQPYHGRNSVLEVVAAAKPNLRADVRHIQVLRPSPDGEFRRKLTVDLDAMVRGGDTTLDVVLAEGDVVFVPPTALGSIGLAWQQLFGRTPESTPQPRPEPREVAVVASAETPTTPQPVAAETTHAADPQTLAEMAELRSALSALTSELKDQREAQAAWLAQLEAAKQAQRKQEEQVEFRSHRRETGETIQGPPPHATVYTTADVQRGGAGEDAQPDGVRFWGP